MIVEEIITNLEDKKIKDTITLNYHERFIRRKKLVSDNNFEFLVNLPETISVNKDEGFLLENDQIILIKYAKETLIEIKSDDLIKIAWHIGNRHIPCQIENDRLLIQEDKVIEKLIIRLGGSIKTILEEFCPEGGAYGLGRTHGHKH
ncbi:MAG: urease accessory protein UreE [Candidatus Puniceispirillales bacterium]|jgi:urease accessory protein